MTVEVLTSVDKLELISNKHLTSKTSVILIGYVDKPLNTLVPNDLLLYLGTPNDSYNWGGYMLVRIRTWLHARRIAARFQGTNLYVGSTLVAGYTQRLTNTYNQSQLVIKLPDGLNKYGIAGYEVYDELITLTQYYLAITKNEKGDT